ncbi:MAG: hypothetical protein ACREUZ_11325, partial [Burkholderiales bacterium]
VLQGGAELTAQVERCIGSAGVPISDDDLARKTRGQLETAYAADVSAQILDEAWTMARQPRADRICAWLGQVHAR